MLTEIKVIVEKHADGYVAYPLGCKGVVAAQGDTYDEALADVKSAIKFHVESFGPDVLNTDTPVLEVFVAEGRIGEPAIPALIEALSHPQCRNTWSGCVV